MPRVKKEETKTPVKEKKVAVKPVIKKVVAKRAKNAEMAIDVFDIKGKVVEKISLPKEIFGNALNQQLVAQAVRVYLANKRSGSASTKSRGEVQGSTRKIYRQKGTGRARHGSVRAPIFVHGGVAFGPKPRDFSLSMPKKMKKKALYSALSAKYKAGDITVVSGLEKVEPKTKVMAGVFQRLFSDRPAGKTMLVMPSKFENVMRASRNIEGVCVTMADQLNTYEVMSTNMILFMKDAIATLQQHLSEKEDSKLKIKS